MVWRETIGTGRHSHKLAMRPELPRLCLLPASPSNSAAVTRVKFQQPCRLTCASPSSAATSFTMRTVCDTDERAGKQAVADDTSDALRNRISGSGCTMQAGACTGAHAVPVCARLASPFTAQLALSSSTSPLRRLACSTTSTRKLRPFPIDCQHSPAAPRSQTRPLHTCQSRRGRRGAATLRGGEQASMLSLQPSIAQPCSGKCGEAEPGRPSSVAPAPTPMAPRQTHHAARQTSTSYLTQLLERLANLQVHHEAGQHGSQACGRDGTSEIRMGQAAAAAAAEATATGSSGSGAPPGQPEHTLSLSV